MLLNIKPSFSPSVKRNKIIFLIINTLAMYPIIKNYFSPCLAAVAGAFFIIHLIIAIKSDDAISASAFTSLYVFSDMAIILTVLICAWVSQPDILFSPELRYYDGAYITPLIIGGAVFFVTGIGAYISGFIFSAACLMMAWNSGTFLDPVISPAGKTIIFVFAVLMIIWYIACGITASNKKFKAGRILNRWLGVLLFIALAAINVLGYQVLENNAWIIATWMRETLPPFFEWWKVVLASVVLMVLAAAMFDFSKNNSSHDTETFTVLASGIILFKVISVNYFEGNWVIALIFLAGSFYGLSKAGSEDHILEMYSPCFYWALCAYLIVSVLAIKGGLWINFVVTTIFALLLHSMGNSRIKDNHKPMRWGVILFCIAAEAAAFVWTMRLSVDVFLLIAIIFAVSCCAMYILNIRDAAGMSAEWQLKAGLCVMMAVTLFAAVWPGGSAVKYIVDENEHSIVVTAKARGENNTIDSLEIYKDDELLNIKAFPAKEGAGVQANIPTIQGKYTAVATDAAGMKTTKSYWVNVWENRWLSQNQYKKPVVILNWKEAYAEKLSLYETMGVLSGEERFYLVYVDNDNTPELWIDNFALQNGGELWGYNSGEMHVLSTEMPDFDVKLSYGGMGYNKKSGKFFIIYTGKAGKYDTRMVEAFYNMSNGVCTLENTGYYVVDEDMDVDDDTVAWNGEPCSWKEYKNLRNLPDEIKMIDDSDGFEFDELMAIIKE